MAFIEKRGEGSGPLTAPTTSSPTSATNVLPAQPGRMSWGIKAAPGNTGVAYFTFNGTATAANGIPLNPDEAYVEPVAGNVVWDGAVSALVTGTDKVTVWSY